jgi:hypothetical protein
MTLLYIFGSLMIDADDWALQASQMGHIYSMSHITISATDGHDGSMGLFRPRRIFEAYPGTGIFVRELLDRGLFIDGPSESPSYPLMKRAWCYQERMLSTRVIHYKSAGMVFECRTGYCDEIGDGDAVQVFLGQKSEYATALLHSDTEHEPSHEIQVHSPSSDDNKSMPDPEKVERLNKQYKLWATIVNSFSSRELTYRTDVLPALSSIASQIYLSQMGKYLAGLWENDLVCGLLWVCAMDPDEFSAAVRLRCPNILLGLSNRSYIYV